MTFSIAARCAKTGQLGVALSSSSIAVGARCPWLLAGVGAVSSQNITLPMLGQQVLEKLEQGVPPGAALDNVLANQRFSEYRQVIAIDSAGVTAGFSGEQTLGVYHAAQGRDCVAAGNMLADQQVINAMVAAFERATGQLTDRLMAALQAAVDNGGEAGPVHSAAVKVVGSYSWPIVDLRVDWAEHDPIGELAALWQAYAPQMQAYIVRAVDPREAPSYGVPGDE
ncbi:MULTISPECIES: DUF1028 domain-containing protein [unclassified Serratia (in: enterobacteria)]|uniref:DUF1028 domain-containing protein n=1 Tax=unclassified Serratia (in: enterobacteria) TaxID=2647522 RepID=UPI000500DDB9|nr:MULTISPECIES: DUF1028 domain-containing protein [unclassified Serratia (in: enterobacteria)]KFK94080.1 major pilin protein fimA [Serratia sp. Ag2]KFL00583.1 major pilin protein fimA [Serratia sp. Ag1]